MLPPYTKILACDCVFMAVPATSMVAEVKGPVEKAMVSVLLAFSVRELEAKGIYAVALNMCASVKLLAARMSLACADEPTSRSYILRF